MARNQVRNKVRLNPLRPDASTPLWLQLKHALRDAITFELKSGDRLPSEADLCRHYSLSRVTVRQAITSLVDEGFLHRQHGRGTYVLAPRLAEPMSEPGHFLLSGFDGVDLDHVSVYSAETVKAAKWIAAKLGLEPGEAVHKIRKLFAPGDERAAFRTTFVPRRLAPSLLSADLVPPLHVVLERAYGMQPAMADEAIEFIVADDFRADILQVDIGHPLLMVERLVYLPTGEAVELSRAYYRADKFRFQRRLQRNEQAAMAPTLRGEETEAA